MTAMEFGDKQTRAANAKKQNIRNELLFVVDKNRELPSYKYFNITWKNFKHHFRINQIFL